MIEPVDTSPILLDVVYRRLMAAIIDCSLSPGQRIVQADLAATLGVSRGPVSHVLQVLKHQGLLRDVGKKGLEVAPIDAGKVHDIYQVRAVLDGLAARVAAEGFAQGRLGRAESKMLNDAYTVGVKLSTDTPMSRRVEVDLEFHRSIYRICGNVSISESLEPLLPHVQRAMVLVLDADLRRVQVWHDHRNIMDHILAGNADASAEAATMHAALAGKHTKELLRRMPTNNLSLKAPLF